MVDPHNNRSISSKYSIPSIVRFSGAAGHAIHFKSAPPRRMRALHFYRCRKNHLLRLCAYIKK